MKKNFVFVLILGSILLTMASCDTSQNCTAYVTTAAGQRRCSRLIAQDSDYYCIAHACRTAGCVNRNINQEDALPLEWVRFCEDCTP